MKEGILSTLSESCIECNKCMLCFPIVKKSNAFDVFNIYKTEREHQLQKTMVYKL